MGGGGGRGGAAAGSRRRSGAGLPPKTQFGLMQSSSAGQSVHTAPWDRAGMMHVQRAAACSRAGAAMQGACAAAAAGPGSPPPAQLSVPRLRVMSARPVTAQFWLRDITARRGSPGRALATHVPPRRRPTPPRARPELSLKTTLCFKRLGPAHHGFSLRASGFSHCEARSGAGVQHLAADGGTGDWSGAQRRYVGLRAAHSAPPRRPPVFTPGVADVPVLPPCGTASPVHTQC